MRWSGPHPLVGSAPRKKFRQTDSSGATARSSHTVAMPAARAWAGERKRTGRPGSHDRWKAASFSTQKPHLGFQLMGNRPLAPALAEHRNQRLIGTFGNPHCQPSDQDLLLVFDHPLFFHDAGCLNEFDTTAFPGKRAKGCQGQMIGFDSDSLSTQIIQDALRQIQQQLPGRTNDRPQ